MVTGSVCLGFWALVSVNFYNTSVTCSLNLLYICLDLVCHFSEWWFSVFTFRFGINYVEFLFKDHRMLILVFQEKEGQLSTVSMVLMKLLNELDE